MANWLVSLGHSLCKTYTYTHGRAYGSLRKRSGAKRNEMERNEMKICSLRNEKL